MRLKRKTAPKPRKALLITLITIAILLIGGGAAYAFYMHNSKNNTPTNQQGVNLEKSDTEKAAIDNLKNNPGDKLQNNQTDTPSTPSTNQSSGKQAANVLITNAGIYNGTVSVGGMVTNVTENSGTCTYSFTNGSTKITKTTDTLSNPTSTTCKTVSFSSNELSQSGTWSITLSYSSSTSEGTSSAKEITK